ncbi:MAG TPA: response regulator transcription factor [Clostridiaceae bacterium]|nr:response regulator transcription factor [Clostridiaceae bacterium]
MPVRIAICDDSVEDLESLTDALYKYDRSFDIISYTDGVTFIEEFQDFKYSVDILFLDIYMPGIDGIELAQKIRSERKDIKIIFISLSKEHYPQAYEVFAFNYILKPFDRKRLYEVLDRAMDEHRKENSQKIHFSYKSSVYSVNPREILYVESRDKLIMFHMFPEGTLQCYSKLDEIEKQLPEQSFIRCHQSFIVNASYITEMGHTYFRLGQVVINISKKYLKQAKDQYYKYLFSNMNNP